MKVKKKIRLLAWCMAFVLSICSVQVQAGNTRNVNVQQSIGDVTGDGKVTLADAQIVLKIALKIEKNFSEDNLHLADANKDNKIDLKDAQIVLKLSLRIPVELPEDKTPIEDVTEPAVEVTPPPVDIPEEVTQEGVVTEPTIQKCSHLTLKKIDYKASSCKESGNIEYWICLSCNKCFDDENGTTEISKEDIIIEKLEHTVVIDKATAPTHSSTGLTEGSHCSVCNTVLTKQEEIPMLAENQYSITYNLYDNDNYLQQVGVDNSNPYYYTSEDGLKLANLKVEGYIFEGWYDGAGANGELVKEIKPNTTGNIELYARWTPVEYTIKFDSPLVAVDNVTYTVDQGATLTNPEWFGYTFLGWSDDDGNVVTRVKPGTTGNMTLRANWTSKRNQTIPVDKLDDPIIHEDVESGTYLFAYEIGRIENVPLYTIKDFGNRSGITVTETTSTTGSISETSANTIAQMISNATTRSSSWTLSKEWNDVTTFSEKHASEMGSNITQTENSGISKSGTYNIGGSFGGSNTTSVETTTSSKVSGKIHASVSANISRDVSLSLPLEIAGSEFKVGNSIEVGGEIGGEIGKEDTETTKESETNTKNWNINKGYEGSVATSQNYGISQSLSKKISDEYGYSQSHSQGGSESSSSQLAVSQTDSREYASSFSYSTEKTETTVKEYTNADAPEGYYRLVCAGTVHVFAVVGYDIASSTYYTYTYNVLDDEVKDFIDYSKETSNFDDYENGVLPFEVPYYVNEYIDNVVGTTKGLVVDIDTGKMVAYNGSATDVVIPRYRAIDNGDGTTSVVQIKGIESKVFAGNTKVTSVKLPDTITEIPDSAFAGCTSLKSVECPAITKIGDNAFSDCTALKEFYVTSDVVALGKAAFDGVQKIKVDALNSTVADSGVYSGAKQITVNLASINDVLKKKIYTVSEDTEYFELNGGNKTYNELRIVSDAKTTVINGLTLSSEDAIPLKLSSENVVLNRVTVNTSELALILSSENTKVGLYGNVNINSTGESAVLCKNIELYWANDNAMGKMNVSGNMYVCGQVKGEENLGFSKGGIVYIDADSYEQMEQDSLEWVLESEVPEDAQIVSEKWTYDLTTNIQSAQSYVAGYTLYNTTSTWGAYGAWSGWSRNAVSSSDSRQVQTQQVSDNNAYTQNNYYYYRYWNSSVGAYLYTYSSGMGGTKYTFAQRSGAQPAMYVHGTYSGNTGYRLNNNNGGNGVYFNDEIWYLESTTTVPATSHTEYRYRDRSKVYTYYHTKKEAKESTTEIKTSDTISNVQKWVQYVIK